MKDFDSTCVLILGMHRSGTSALTGALSLMNFELGNEMIPADGSNPKGHFENKNVTRFNDRLLGRMGVTWEDAFRLPLPHSKRPLISNPEEIKMLVEQEFSLKQPILIKDPRLSLLLPEWQHGLSKISLDQKYIIITRHPSEVCASLKKRNNLSYERSEKLWAFYTIAAEYYTRGNKRIFINHENLLSNPEEVIRQIMEFVSAGSIDEQLFQIASDFIEPGLTNVYKQILNSQVQEGLVYDTYELLKSTGNAKNDKGLAVKLDNVSSKLSDRGYFSSPFKEEHVAEIRITYEGGEIQNEIFLVTKKDHTFSIKTNPKHIIEYIRFTPCNLQTVLSVCGITLVTASGKKESINRIRTNATLQNGNTYLFTMISPIISKAMKVSDVVDIEVCIRYEMIGDKASKYYALNHLAMFSDDNILIPTDISAEILRLQKLVDKKSNDVSEFKNSAAYRLGKTLLAPVYIIYNFFK